MSASPDFAIVIPARHDAQRLPGKLLAPVAGRPLLEWTWRVAVDSGATDIVVATDDERIRAAATAFGAEVQMTDHAHRSGSDRIAECARRLDWAGDRIIVNLQGDEPLMPPACIDQVARLLDGHPDAAAGTLFTDIDDPDEVTNPNVVKVVTAHDASALYFSRAPIPWSRDHASVTAAIAQGVRWRRHLGLYAYRRATLDWFSATPPAALEQIEKLEQLRFLAFGKRIMLARAEAAIPPGVDSPADLERVRRILEHHWKEGTP